MILLFICHSTTFTHVYPYRLFFMFICMDICSWICDNVMYLYDMRKLYTACTCISITNYISCFWYLHVSTFISLWTNENIYYLIICLTWFVICVFRTPGWSSAACGPNTTCPGCSWRLWPGAFWTRCCSRLWSWRGAPGKGGLACWLAGWLAGWLSGLAVWLSGCLACGWLAGWLADWLAGLVHQDIFLYRYGFKIHVKVCVCQ